MTSTSDEVGHTLDLDAIEARANAATPGPWTETKPKPDHTGFGGMIVAATAPRQGIYTSGASGTYPSADRTFIAHARTDIPALLAGCRSLRNSHDSLVKALEGIADPENLREPKRSDHATDAAYWVVCGIWMMALKARAALSQAKGGK